MIAVKGLTHDYEGKGKPSVKDVSFTIENGTIFGFLGPSGAGKSTTQALMTGLLSIQAGEISYDGRPLQKLGNAFYNKIGVSFEHPNVFGKLTGRENLAYHAGLYAVETEDPRRLLEMVGLADAANRRASAYSKGMKQRLIFARSLLNKPSILFLDEPTSGLDPATAERVKDIIRRKREEGCTIFLTTHNMHTADELCDVVAFLNDGEIVAMDAPRELKLQYGERSVAVEHRTNGSVTRDVFFPEKADDAARLKSLIDGGRVETIHSQEATLEQIFIRLTGRGLA
jgi:fluoroquinolone transport system ATP-binding protein